MALTFPSGAVSAHDWRARAACRRGSGVDPEIFFPTAKSGALRERQEAAALAVCARCPVAAPCLAFAFEHLPEGIAGGLTAAQRDVVLRERHAAERAAARQAGSEPTPRSAGSAPLGRPSKGERIRTRGITLLIAGADRHEVSRATGVSLRTVERWATLPEVAPRLPERERVHPLSRREARRAGARAVAAHRR